MTAIRQFLWAEWKSILWGALLVLVMQGLEYGGWISGMEGRVLDAYQRRPFGWFETPEPPIVLVEIDDAAYQACMGGTSPMPPERIQWLLDSLFASVRPRTVGVDILTDSPQHNYGGLLQWQRTHAPTTVVWATPPLAQTSMVPAFPLWMIGREEELFVQPAKVLGQQPFEDGKLEQGESRNRWAVPVFPKDDDLRLRKFPREVHLVLDNKIEVGPTWAMKLAEVNRAEPSAGENDIPEVLIAFYKPIQARYSVSQLFECKQPAKPTAALAEFARVVTKDPGTIVLVGGTWATSGDFHYTPGGKLPGLEVNALALRAELKGERVHEPPRWMMVVLDFAVSIMIVLAFYRGTRVRAMMRNSARVVFVVFLLSRGLFSFGYIWLSWIGVVIGFAPHLLVEIYRKDPTVSEHSHH